MSNFFARIRATESRLLRRSCESLLGICSGLLADSVLNEDEVRYLDHWLRDNDAISGVWPGSEIARRVRKVLSDSQVTDEELQHLKTTLAALVGGTIEDTGSPRGGLSTKAIPFDTCQIEFKRRNFCLTGEFLHGARSKCVATISERGGDVLKAVRRDLHYLVVGTLVNEEWKHSSYGTKIQKAMEYRTKGVPILIVSEESWAQCLTQ